MRSISIDTVLVKDETGKISTPVPYKRFGNTVKIFCPKCGIVVGRIETLIPSEIQQYGSEYIISHLKQNPICDDTEAKISFKVDFIEFPELCLNFGINTEPK